MAQQSKTALTSRPLTKALGTASILSLAIAGANVANAIQTDIGVDYRAQFFAVDSEAFDGNSDTDNGFANLLRLKADFRHEATGVSLHTRTQLAGDRWSGDKRGDHDLNGDQGTGSSGHGSYSSDGNENVTLDLAYVQVPFDNGSVLRVGRQEANWNNCFLVCDDRRDRIMGMIPTAAGTLILGYDRRRDDTAFNNTDNGDMVNVGLVTRLGGFSVGLLWVHWLENSDEGYPLHGVHLFSPYIQGQIADNLNLAVGMNWFGQGNNDGPAGDQYFTENAWSQYLRLGTSLDVVDLNFQAVLTQDGGLVSPGFDTYSSLINNNPESTASPTSLVRMGGTLGVEDHEEMLFIAQAGFKVSPALTLKAAVGYYDIDNGTVSDDSMVYDLQAHYRVNEAVSTSVTWGMITKNDAGTTAGNSLVPGSARANYADDDLMAASVNLYVNF